MTIYLEDISGYVRGTEIVYFYVFNLLVRLKKIYCCAVFGQKLRTRPHYS